MLQWASRYFDYKNKKIKSPWILFTSINLIYDTSQISKIIL